MKPLSLFAIFTCLVTTVSAHAKACAFNAQKVNSVVQTQLAQDLLPLLPFWNQTPPTVNCRPSRSNISCDIRFAAKDGTPFYVSNDSNRLLSIDTFQMAVDAEGNYVKPTTCMSSLDSETDIYNRNTGNPVPFPIWEGSSTDGDPLVYTE